MFNLEWDDLIGHYWKGLDSYRSAFSDFEPTAKHPGVGKTITQKLFELGLLERGENTRYKDFGHCYRVTDLGWKVLQRGKKAKPHQKPRKLRQLPPRLSEPPPRLKYLP